MGYPCCTCPVLFLAKPCRAARRAGGIVAIPAIAGGPAFTASYRDAPGRVWPIKVKPSYGPAHALL